jgi:hypothetical protein
MTVYRCERVMFGPVGYRLDSKMRHFSRNIGAFTGALLAAKPTDLKKSNLY